MVLYLILFRPIDLRPQFYRCIERRKADCLRLTVSIEMWPRRSSFIKRNARVGMGDTKLSRVYRVSNYEVMIPKIENCSPYIGECRSICSPLCLSLLVSSMLLEVMGALASNPLSLQVCPLFCSKALYLTTPALARLAEGRGGKLCNKNWRLTDWGF